jgi:hypothetical protein
MGLKIGFSSDFEQSYLPDTISPLGNPNPLHFKILEHVEIGSFVVLKVKYPECRNYEGTKILVFENVKLKTFKNITYLDPHFCKSGKHPSPIARFRPDKKGWEYSLLFCKNAQQ